MHKFFWKSIFLAIAFVCQTGIVIACEPQPATGQSQSCDRGTIFVTVASNSIIISGQVSGCLCGTGFSCLAGSVSSITVENVATGSVTTLATNITANSTNGAYSFTKSGLLAPGEYIFTMTDNTNGTACTTVTISSIMRGVLNTSFGNQTPTNGVMYSTASAFSPFSEAVGVLSTGAFYLAGNLSDSTLGLVPGSASGIPGSEITTGILINGSVFMAVQNNDQFVVATTSISNKPVILLFNSDGTLNLTFNTTSSAINQVLGLVQIGTNSYIIGTGGGNVIIEEYNSSGNLVASGLNQAGSIPVLGTDGTQLYFAFLNTSSTPVIGTCAADFSGLLTTNPVISNMQNPIAIAAKNGQFYLAYTDTSFVDHIVAYSSALVANMIFDNNVANSLTTIGSMGIANLYIDNAASTLIAVGIDNNTSGPLVASFNFDGTLDTTFNNGTGFNSISELAGLGVAVGVAANGSDQLIVAFQNTNGVFAAFELGVIDPVRARRSAIVSAYSITSPTNGSTIGQTLLPISLGGAAPASQVVSVVATNTTTSEQFSFSSITTDSAGNWATPTIDFTQGSYNVVLSTGSTTQATSTFTVDLTPPATPTLESFPTLISLSLPTIQGTATPGATISLINGTPLSGSVIADASGNWSFGLANLQVNGVPLSQGTFSTTTTYTQIDANGNTSQPSNAINSVVQLQATSCGTNNPSGTVFAVTCPASLPIQIGATINNPLIAVTGSGNGFLTIVSGVIDGTVKFKGLTFLINQTMMPTVLVFQETDPSGAITTISVPVEFVVQVKPFVGSPLAEAIFAKYCL